MVSLKFHVISTILMVFITIDKTYSRTCKNIMAEYFPDYLGIYESVYVYHRIIFFNLVYDEMEHFEVKAYMNFLSQGIDHLNPETKLPKEFCKNSENSKICRKQLKNCGFTSDNARDNFQYAYFNLSGHNLTAYEHAKEYINYLFEEVTFNYQITSGGNSPWEYCPKIEKCSNSINSNFPEASSCQTIDELFNHIYEKIDINDIQDSDTRKYVDFIFKFAENGVSEHTQLPIQFCKRFQDNINEHENVVSEEGYTLLNEHENVDSEEVCNDQLENFGFLNFDIASNVIQAYYKLTLRTIQGNDFAESYFNYLRSQTSINYDATADGFLPSIYCLKATYIQ